MPGELPKDLLRKQGSVKTKRGSVKLFRRKAPEMNNGAILDADPSRLAALLVAYIVPLC